MNQQLTFLLVVMLMATLSVNAQRTYLDQTIIDRSVKSGDDFFTYANGGWIKANEIPATESYWDSGAIIQKQTRLRLQELIKALSQKKNTSTLLHKLAWRFLVELPENLREMRGCVKPH